MADQTAMMLTQAEWQSMARIAQSYLDSGNDWAENDDDDEAMEIRAARDLCKRLRVAAGA